MAQKCNCHKNVKEVEMILQKRANTLNAKFNQKKKKFKETGS